MPVGERALRAVEREILREPSRLAGEPRAGRAAAARLHGALDVQRDDVPAAEVVGVPAVAVRADVAGLAVLARARLRECADARRVLREAVGHDAAVGVVLVAVVVVEVAVAVDARLAVVGVELVVARGGALEELEGAVGRVERAHEVLVATDLVLLVAEDRDERRVHRLDLVRGRRLRLHARRAAAAGLVADVLLLLGLERSAGLAGDVADRGQHRRMADRRVGPRIVGRREHAVGGEHRAGERRERHDRGEREPQRQAPSEDPLHVVTPSFGYGRDDAMRAVARSRCRDGIEA